MKGVQGSFLQFSLKGKRIDLNTPVSQNKEVSTGMLVKSESLNVLLQEVPMASMVVLSFSGFLIQLLELEETTICVGSCVQMLDEHQVFHLIIVTQLLVVNLSFQVAGLELFPTDVSITFVLITTAPSWFSVLKIRQFFEVLPA